MRLLCSQGYTCFCTLSEACCEHSSIVFARRMRKVCKFELGEDMGVRERSMWSQEHMYRL